MTHLFYLLSGSFQHKAGDDGNGNAVSTTRLSFGLRWRAVNCVGSQICPCLKRACLGQDWFWLHFGETEQSGLLETGAWLRWRAGCSRQCSPAGGRSSAGTVSTSELSDTWPEPASGPWKKSDPLTTNTRKISLKDRNTSLLPWRLNHSCHATGRFKDNTIPSFQGVSK